MRRKTIAAIIVSAAVLLCGAGLAYIGDYYRADETAFAALAPGENVEIRQEDGVLAFEPEAAETGFIFYPGGKVEYTAYAPLMRRLAEENVFCALVEMPFNLAVLDINAADRVREMYPEIDRWYIGGHSLGGSMAASHAAGCADVYSGLVLLAAYSTADLTENGLKVISLYGSEDGVLNMEKYEKYRANLPDDTMEVVIDGGCHACFGSYGAQAGDGAPGITAEEQIEITAEALVGFIVE